MNKSVTQHRHEYHEVDGIYFETEEEKQKFKEGNMKQEIKTTTVASTETDVLKTEELIFLGEILQNPRYDNLLQQHYADLFGSRGEIIGKITDKKLTDIVNGIIETCNDNIEVMGCRQEPEVYINLTDRQFNEEKQWIRNQAYR